METKIKNNNYEDENKTLHSEKPRISFTGKINKIPKAKPRVKFDPVTTSESPCSVDSLFSVSSEITSLQNTVFTCPVNKNPNLTPFEEIPVSTKTFIIMTNVKINIQKLFEFLPVTDYIIVQKKRGRKKKEGVIDPNADLPDGSIITIDLANNIRGVSLKKKKRREGKTTDYFRNSITIVMIMDRKKINFKISNNGKFQMTGVKKDKHAEDCIKSIWDLIKGNPELYSWGDEPILTENTNTSKARVFRAIFIPAMRNIDFSLGFTLDREKLDEYFNTHTRYSSLLETSIGYTGVNIKIPVEKPIRELLIGELTCTMEGEDKSTPTSFHSVTPTSFHSVWNPPTKIPYDVYLKTLKPKEQQKKLEKDRHNTFLVFHSGKVIMSSMCEDFARDTYYEFLDIVRKNSDYFRECLAPMELERPL